MTISDIDRNTLLRTYLFRDIPQPIFETLIACATVKQLGKDQVLFRQGEAADHFFVVLEGWVKVSRISAAGDEAVLGVFGPGEAFAEAAMFLGGIYPATATAVQDARICCFGSVALRTIANRNADVLFSMLGSLSKHLHAMTEQVEQLKTRNGEQRLAMFIANLCGNASGACDIQLPYDKTLLAARLGMRPESLSRFLTRLATIGVHSTGHKISIQDVNLLREYCEASPHRRERQ